MRISTSTKMLILGALPCALAILFSDSFAFPLPSPTKSWRKAKVGKLTFYWHREVEPIALRFIAVSGKVARRVEEITGLKIPRTSVVIYLEDDLSAGWASVLPRNTIYINAGEVRAESIFLPAGPEAILSHELAHIVSLGLDCPHPTVLSFLVSLFFLDVNTSTPRFIHEGYASWVEGKVSGRKILPFVPDFHVNRISGDMLPVYGGGVHYTAGADFFSYLERRFGRSRIREFFEKNSCFLPYAWFVTWRKVFGESFAQTFRRWKEWRKRQVALEVERYRVAEGDLTEAESVFDFPSRGVALFKGKVLTTKLSGELTDGKTVIAKRKHAWLFDVFELDGKMCVLFDSKTSEGFDIFFGCEGEKPVRLTHGRKAQYPSYSRGKVWFVERKVEGDGICYLELMNPQNSRCVLFLEGERVFSLSATDFALALALMDEDGWLDIAILELSHPRKLKFITRDPHTDLFPSWFGSSVIFSSDRDGYFNLYLWQGEDELLKLTNLVSGAFESATDGRKIFFVGLSEKGPRVFSADFKIVKAVPLGKYRKGKAVRKVKVEGERVGFEFPFPPRLAPFFMYSSLTGRGIGLLGFYFSDTLMRISSFVLAGADFPLSSPSAQVVGFETVRVGFSASFLLRYFLPYLYLSFSSDPFSAVAVRKGERIFAFPKRTLTARAFGVLPVGKVSALFGASYISVRSDMPELVPQTAFWRYATDEWLGSEAGDFILPTFGFLARTSRRTFHLSSGVDFYALLSAVLGEGLLGETFVSIYSPVFWRSVVQLELSFSASTVERRVFQPEFGSQPYPYYFDPPYDFLTVFDVFSAFRRAGIIYGVFPQRAKVGGTATVKFVKLVARGGGVWFLPLWVDWVKLSPFVSAGFAERFLRSAGAEVEIDTTAFYYVPISLRVGVAYGDFPELYFFFYLTPGETRW